MSKIPIRIMASSNTHVERLSKPGIDGCRAGKCKCTRRPTLYKPYPSHLIIYCQPKYTSPMVPPLPRPFTLFFFLPLDFKKKVLPICFSYASTTTPPFFFKKK